MKPAPSNRFAKITLQIKYTTGQENKQTTKQNGVFEEVKNSTVDRTTGSQFHLKNRTTGSQIRLKKQDVAQSFSLEMIDMMSSLIQYSENHVDTRSTLSSGRTTQL